jgi:ACS family sodium-dependent inorganic phosphate cotransporter
MMGVGEGVNFPCVFNLFSRWFPKEEENELASIAETGVYWGIVTAMLLVPVIEHHVNWESVFYIFGALGIVWAIVFYKVAASTPHEHSDNDESSPVYEKFQTEIKYIEATAPGSVAHNVKVPWVKIITEPAIWALGIAKLSYYYCFFTVLSWQPTYYRDLGMKEDVASYSSALPFLVTVISIVSFGFLASELIDTQHHSKAVVRKTLGGIGLISQSACFFWLASVRSPVTALGVYSLMYFLNAAFIPGVALNVLDLGPKYTGSIMAFTHTIATMSGALCNVLNGIFLEMSEPGHYELVYYVCSAISLVGGVVYLLFSKQHVCIE